MPQTNRHTAHATLPLPGDRWHADRPQDRERCRRREQQAQAAHCHLAMRGARPCHACPRLLRRHNSTARYLLATSPHRSHRTLQEL
eukprot:scaffold52816_cov59-Phaeocystis_antarctica.AAC.2